MPEADRAKFDALRKLLESQLSGIAVYKIGAEPEQAVYIVGKTKDGRWAGLKTTVVVPGLLTHGLLTARLTSRLTARLTF